MSPKPHQFQLMPHRLPGRLLCIVTTSASTFDEYLVPGMRYTTVLPVGIQMRYEQRYSDYREYRRSKEKNGTKTYTVVLVRSDPAHSISR